MDSHFTDSHDAYWCDIQSKPDLFLECLDIAASDTLSNTLNNAQWNVAGNSLSITDIDSSGVVLVDGTAIDLVSTSTNLFGTRASNQCNGKTHGDRAISTHDMTIMMMYQFGVGPYASIAQTPQLVETVQGYTNMAAQCGSEITRAAHFLYYAEDSCYDTENPEEERRRLEAPQAPQVVQVEQSKLQMVHARKMSPSMLEEVQSQKVHDLGARVIKWKSVPGVGSWYRINLPVNALSLDLAVPGTEGAMHIPLSNEAPPKFEDDAIAPADPNEYHVRFERHIEHHNNAQEQDSCAPIISMLSPDVVLNRGALGIGQVPFGASRMCAFDVYVWVPTASRRRELMVASGGKHADRALQSTSFTDTDAQSSCEIVVSAGSTAMDGMGGAVQLATSTCIVTWSMPPPPLSPPSPPSPPPPPPPTEVTWRSLRFSMLVVPLGLVVAAVVAVAYQTSCFGIQMTSSSNIGGQRVQVDVTTAASSPPGLARPQMPTDQRI